MEGVEKWAAGDATGHTQRARRRKRRRIGVGPGALSSISEDVFVNGHGVQEILIDTIDPFTRYQGRSVPADLPGSSDG